ncbi:MAG: Fur family transcriptional regulator [Actinomycetota bacterium]|nr:Fur family transcriptional regulator [Actinomycetota bacterium]
MQHLEQAVEQHLATTDVRLTQGRRSTVEALATMPGPRTAAEIHDQIGDAVPLSSLYRSLSVLTDADVLSAQHGSDGVIRFELAEWITGHHHHLVCTSCGTVVDVTPTVDQEAAMEQLVEKMAHEAGFDVSGHRFEIEGTCRKCR